MDAGNGGPPGDPEIVTAIDLAVIAAGLARHADMAEEAGREADHRALVVAAASQRRAIRKHLGDFVQRIGVD